MMERLLNKWVGGACLLIAAFGLFFVWFYWPNVYTYCGGSMGDVCSVFGFGLGLLGFAITIATLLDIRQISETARAEMRRDLHGAMQRVALVLLSSETSSLLRLISEIRAASRVGQWETAFVLSQEARLAVNQSLGNPLLLDAERQVILDAGLDLRIILRYIERKRLAATQAGLGQPIEPLPQGHIEKLDAMIPALGDIHARLRQQALEVPNA